ncbi:hypothetical protein K474DRAFT_1665944 [Panus rudis PR-1116 ss-1]|nr:hypothetical protein K474DRAFT_1665944 [Panus rudis PR-1116 ss-1]
MDIRHSTYAVVNKKQEYNLRIAEEMSQKFLGLRRDVETYILDMETILHGYDVEGAERRIKELDDDIKILLDELDSIHQQVVEVSKQLDIVIAATSISGIFGFLAPVWWIATAIGAATIPQLKAQLSALQSQENEKTSLKRTKEVERARLQADIETISLLRTTLQESDPTFKTLITQSGAFGAVWAAIRADTQALMEKLELVGDTESWALFKKRVETAAELYRKLKTALETYRNQVQGRPSLVAALEKCNKETSPSPATCAP